MIEHCDVLYVTRVQKERFTDITQYEEVKSMYEINPEVMKKAKDKMVVMHPLPRIGEISTDVDEDPRAAYFRQVKNGMYIRMALVGRRVGEGIIFFVGASADDLSCKEIARVRQIYSLRKRSHMTSFSG